MRAQETYAWAADYVDEHGVFFEDFTGNILCEFICEGHAFRAGGKTTEDASINAATKLHAHMLGEC